MNAPHSSDFFFNTFTGMLELLKNTRRDKMRQNETVGARVPSALRQKRRMHKDLALAYTKEVALLRAECEV